MFKKINVPGIAALVVILCLLQFGVGLLISPAASAIILKKINESGNLRIKADSINLWPLTLSVSLKNINVAALDGSEYKKLVTVSKGSAKVSFWALLSKKVVISSVVMSNGELFIEAGADGRFNVEKIAAPDKKDEAGGKGGPMAFMEGLGKKKDLFTKVYDLLKKRGSAAEKDKTVKEKTAVKANVAELAKGKRVNFVNPWKDYLFTVKTLNIKDVKVYMKAQDGENIEMDKVNISLKNLSFDPALGGKIGKVNAKGLLMKNGKDSGEFGVAYASEMKNKNIITDFDIKARDIDMEAIGFIYEASSPVIFKRGILNLNSKTSITGENIDSVNAISVREHFIEPRSSKSLNIGALTTPLICEAINAIENPELKFKISGTVNNPELKGFQESLQGLIKPYMGNIKERGVSGITKFFTKEEAGSDGGEGASKNIETNVKDAIGNIKSLFGSGEK